MSPSVNEKEVRVTRNAVKIKNILDGTFPESWGWFDIIASIIVPGYKWYMVDDVAVCCVVRCPRKNHVAMFGVLPEYQRRGYGSLLMQEVFKQSKESRKKTTLMVRESNPAREIYAHYGFVEMKRIKGYYKNGEVGYYCER